MKFAINYGKGSGLKDEVIELASFRNACYYASNKAKGWGYTIKYYLELDSKSPDESLKIKTKHPKGCCSK